MADESRPQSARMDTLKQRVYSVALTIAGTGALLGYFLRIELAEYPILRFAFGPVITAICYGFALVLRIWPRALGYLERTAYIGAGAFLIVRLALLLFMPRDVSVVQLVADIGPWTAAVFVLAFVALETRQAVPAAIGLYGVQLMLVGAFVLHRGLDTLDKASVNALVQEFVIANATTSALLWFMARTKEELAKERTERVLLAKIAHTDELTGIANRRSIVQACQKAIDRSMRDGQPFSVVMFDVDHFKRVNDTFGHAMGDAVLQRVAQVVFDSLRAGDDFGRFGGEEFLVLAYGADTETAVPLAERLRSAIADDHPPGMPRVTASFGVATVRPDESLAMLLARADQALYAAKASGRNRVLSETDLETTGVSSKPAPAAASS